MPWLAGQILSFIHGNTGCRLSQNIPILNRAQVVNGSSCQVLILSFQKFAALPRLDPHGIVIAAPPCSMYGPACSSIHKRSLKNPRGDMNNFKVRLAWRIWTSFASWQQMNGSESSELSAIQQVAHTRSYKMI